MFVPSGIALQRKRIAEIRRGVVSGAHLRANVQAIRREDIAHLAIACT